MVKYGELDQALSPYICADTHDVIPVEYYRRVIKTAIKVNSEGKQWDMQQAAAVLLYFVFNDGLETIFLKPELGDSAGVFGAAMLVAE